MKHAILAALVMGSLPLAAQTPLTLEEAVRQALTAHPSIEAANARIQAAEARRTQARSGYLPRVQYQEQYQRGNNPVYVFGALLTQHQFTEANFAIHSLNRPAALNNFQSQVVAEQTLYDFGSTKSATRAAELGRKLTEEDKRALELQVVQGVARAYHGVTLAAESLKVAEEAVKSAEADLKRAEAVRAAGLATDSDVLSVKVHLSAMQEQQIRRSYDLDVSKAALNEALGLPLDTPHQLTTALTPALPATPAATSARPELEQARLSASLAETQAAGAKLQLLPQFFTRGVFETDRQEFVNKGGANWMFMAGMRWTLFDGNRARAQAAEARYLAAGARATERQLQSALALEVRKAESDVKSATERIAVTDAAVTQAEESLRILRNRYSTGLANVTDLLRAQTAVLEAKTRRLAAVHDQRLAAINVERAAGTLNPDSPALR